jgi:2-polyprenyl-6-methoxyphenol hydroxylase-like FAD-dependent oxidoreductase
MNDVVVVGAGPVGLMQACELQLAGVQALVLEQRTEPSELPRANGLGGMIVRLLSLRGLLPRLTEGSPFHGPFPGFPFGSVPLRFAQLADNPMLGVMIQQPRLEAVLAERAVELGVEIRRGHELVGLTQDADGCTLHTASTQGAYDLYTRFVVGCDGGRSTVRDLAGIGFPGSTDREVLRLGHFATDAKLFHTPEGLRPGWNRTPRGRVLVTSLQPGVHVVGVRDEVPANDEPMTLAELQDAFHRVLGAELPPAEPIWVSRTISQARIAEKYRAGRIFLAGDAAHLFPAGGSSLNIGLLDTVNLGWKLAAVLQGQAPDDLLDTYESERYPAGERALMQTRTQAVLDRVPGEDGDAIRGLFSELVEYEQPLRHMAALLDGSDIRYQISDAHPLIGTFIQSTTVDLSTAHPVLLDNELLIRPDGYIAWTPNPEYTLDEALARWCGSVEVLHQHR